MKSPFFLQYRVYYRDTDAAGIMYHARYCELFEAGRMEFFRSLGISAKDLHTQGVIFPVSRLHIVYKNPAFLDDFLWLSLSLNAVGRSKIDFSYQIKKKNNKSLDSSAEEEFLVVEGETVNACVGLKSMKLMSLPKNIKKTLTSAIH